MQTPTKLALCPWRAALYVRLSRDDGDKLESNSVTSQKAILREFVKLHPDITVHDTYIDDGWSGTSFDRPGFQRMMEDIYSGQVNCVIVKDLSRFGRNASEVGYYIDNVFLRHRVRFLALNNALDTAKSTMNAANQLISVGVTNVINESVAATTSVNVRGTLNVNRQQGKFIGSFPSYGYLKDPEDHHKLLVDQETAPIVRMIFEDFVRGTSIAGIAKKLNAMGIPNPAAYKRSRHARYRHPAGEKNDGLWPDSSVRRILRNEMYIGTMIQGKNATISYKIRQCRAVPKEEWFRVEGTHEAIIDRETFDKAQNLFNRNIRKPVRSDDVLIFSGLVRCGHCGRIMSKKTNRHSYGTYHYYRCVTHNKMDPTKCTGQTIRIDRLEKAVLTYLQTMVAVSVEYDQLLDKIRQSSQRKTQSTHLKQTLDSQLAEREKLVRMQLELYPDWKNGIITQEEYLTLKADLQSKLQTLDRTIEKLRTTVEQYAEGTVRENPFLTSFQKYHNVSTLTRAMLVELVREIRVYEGGRLEIILNFRDELQELMNYLELNQDALEDEEKASP